MRHWLSECSYLCSALGGQRGIFPVATLMQRLFTDFARFGKGLAFFPTLFWFIKPSDAALKRHASKPFETASSPLELPLFFTMPWVLKPCASRDSVWGVLRVDGDVWRHSHACSSQRTTG